MGILRRTHSLLLLLTILFVSGVLRADPLRSKRQVANQPWNFFRNMYRQRFLNQQRLANNQLVGPRRGPLLINNQGQTGVNNQLVGPRRPMLRNNQRQQGVNSQQAGPRRPMLMNNQRLFNNRRFAYPPSNSPMNNRFFNNFRNPRRFFRPWRNPRLLNQGPLLIPGPLLPGVVQNTPPQDPTDAPEFVNGVLVTEPPDPTDPPEIPPAQASQTLYGNPYANMFWRGYSDPAVMGQTGLGTYNPADPTEPPEPPEPPDPPDYPPATTPTPVPQAAPSSTSAPSNPLSPNAPLPPNGHLSPSNSPARIQSQLSFNQQAAPGATGPSFYQNRGTGKPPNIQQIGPWASQPLTSPLTPKVIFADNVPKTTQAPAVQPVILILPLTTRSVDVTATPRTLAVTPSGVSYRYLPRRGYNPTLTRGTNLAPWRQVMWNRMLFRPNV